MRILITMILGLRLAAAAPTLNAWADRGIHREVAAAKRHDLTRLEDWRHLDRFRVAGILVPLPERGHGFVLDHRIGGRASAHLRPLYRLARPYTVRFVKRLGEQYVARTGRHLRITSIVRTCAYQMRLASGNGNAAPCEHSTHLTGATIDISYVGMPRRDREWIEGVLLYLEGKGLVEATKETVQPVYHVMVLPPYARHRPR